MSDGQYDTADVRAELAQMKALMEKMFSAITDITEGGSAPAVRRERTISTQEAMDYLEVGQSTLYRLCQSGRIRYMKTGRGYKFRQIWLEEYESKNTISPITAFGRGSRAR